MAGAGFPSSTEEAAQTDAEREALAAVRTVTGEQSSAMERHGLRVFPIASKLAERRAVARLVGHALRERPLTMPRIFLRGR